MLNLNDRHLCSSMCNPAPIHPVHHNGGMFPHGEPPRYTLPEEVERTNALMRDTLTRMAQFEERLKADYEAMVARIENDNSYFKTTLYEAHRIFLEDVQREINTFESSIDSAVSLFKTEMEAEMNARFETTEATMNELNTRITTAEGNLLALETRVNELIESLETATEG